MPASRCQASTSRVEHVPGTAFAHDGADPGLGGKRPLGAQRLRALPQHRPGYAEHRDHLGIARQACAFRVAARDDVDADRAGHFRVVEMGPPRRDDDDARRHEAAPALFATGRRAERDQRLLQRGEGE